MSEICYHCGDYVIGKGYILLDKKFCCNGCKMVYQLLTENNMEAFYTLDKKPGVKPSNASINKYSFLEVDSIQSKFIDFQEKNTIKITLFLPQIHCSSCIYLLENASKIITQFQADAKVFRILGEDDMVDDMIIVGSKYSPIKRKPTQKEIQDAYKLYNLRFGSNAAFNLNVSNADQPLFPE